MRGGVNLIPQPVLAERHRRQVVRRALRATGLYLALVVVVTVGYVGLTGPREAGASGGEGAGGAGSLAAVEQRAGLSRAAIARMTGQLADAERRLRAAAVLSERPAWATLLRLIAQGAGADVLLSGVNIAGGGSASGGGSATGSGSGRGGAMGSATVTVTGYAAGPGEVAAFVLRLEGSGVFSRVELASSRREPFGDGVATGFTVRCTMGGANGQGGGR